MSIDNTQENRGSARRRRKLDLSRIKAYIVFVVGVVTALGSGLSGLGAQVAFAPMLTWMLGFKTEKAQATALRYAAFVSAAAVAGAFFAQTLGHKTSLNPPVMPAAVWFYGVLLFLTATLGAVIARPLTPSPAMSRWKQTFQTIGVGIGLFVLINISHQTLLNAHVPDMAGWPRIALIGLGAGVLTQILGLASGVLLVPALYYLGGYSAQQAVAQSLMVVTLASLLPAWTYARRGLVDPVYGNAIILGGVIGGFAGGMLLAHTPEKIVLSLFALIAMFLSARELSRLAFERPARPVT
ncbi:MAG TPA: sulfite exporter TauE/SafE family protein [Chthonomonadaceae bacterium]|nr:sulfite exporter TauE/SafE family protein [Chthonomonadaceae bacterium]